MSLLVKNTFYYFIGNIIGRLGAFLLLPLYTSHLSPEKFGILELIYTTTAFLSILFGEGIAHTTIRFYFDFEAQKARNEVIITSLLTGLTIAILGALFVGIYTAPISDLLFATSKYSHLLQLALVILVFELSIEVLFAYIRARQKAMVYVIASSAKLFTQMSLSIYLVAYKGMGIEGVLISNLFCIFVVWIILLVYVLKECGFGINIKIIKPMMKYLVPFASSSLLAVIFSSIDRYLINYYLGLESLGIYSLSMKFALILTFLLMLPIQKSFGPYRFEIMKSEKAAYIYSKLNIFIVTVAAIFILGMSYYIEFVISLMSAEEYHSASLYVPILLIGVLFQSISYSFQTGILISKRTTALTKITFFTLVASITLNLILIPRFGLFGAASTFLIADLLIALLTLFYSQKLFHIKYEHQPVILIITMLIALMLVGELLPGNLNLAVSLSIKFMLIMGFSAFLLYINKNSFIKLYKEISHPASNLGNNSAGISTSTQTPSNGLKN